VKKSVGPIWLLCAWLSWSVAFGQAPQTGDYVPDPDGGCKVFNPHPVAGETVHWSGGCVDGLAQGRGSLQWLHGGKLSERDDGDWNQGRQSGRGTQNWGSGHYEGELLNGEPNGHGVMTLQSSRYEGEFRNGKPNGEGAVTNLQGVFKGKWRDGCLTVEKRRITFAVSSSTCR
jgi:hypothetical protein